MNEKDCYLIGVLLMAAIINDKHDQLKSRLLYLFLFFVQIIQTIREDIL